MHKPWRFHTPLVVNHIHFIFSSLYNGHLQILLKDKNTTITTTATIKPYFVTLNILYVTSVCPLFFSYVIR